MVNLLALVESVSRGNEDMRILLSSLVQLSVQSGAQKGQLAAPGQASISVTAANGLISWRITNPSNAQNATIYHEVSYSPVKNFSQGVVTLPATPATGGVLPSPGANLFLRLRSSYDSSTWNSYQLAQTSAAAAGLQSSAAMANNTPLNQTNFANVDSIANGSSALVRVYGTAGPYHSYVDVKGGQQTTMPSATIVNASYGSTQVVAFDGQKFRLSAILPGAFPDTWKPVGTVSVVDSGSPSLPVLTPVISGGHLITATFTPGSGLTQAPTLTVTDGGGGTGAVIVGTVSGGHLTGVQVLNPGSGYTGATVITPTGGVFTGSMGGGGNVGGNGGRLVQLGL